MCHFGSTSIHIKEDAPHLHRFTIDQHFPTSSVVFGNLLGDFIFRNILNKKLPFAANRSRYHRVHLSDVQLLRDGQPIRPNPCVLGCKKTGTAPKMGVSRKNKKSFQEGNLQRISGDMSSLGFISTSRRLNHVYYYYHYYHY